MTEPDPQYGVEGPEDEAQLRRLCEQHPSRVGVGRAGPRPKTSSLLQFRFDHAKARDAVTTQVSAGMVDELDLVAVESRATDKSEFLTNPNRGRDISPETAERLREQCVIEPEVQLIVSDGLSSAAVEANIPNLLPVLRDGLAERGLDIGTPIFVELGRVDVMDAIGEELGADCCVNLIGERPGLATNESLSAYFVYGPERGTPTSKKSVISNIHRNGIPPVEAGAEIAAVVDEMCDKEHSGLDFQER